MLEIFLLIPEALKTFPITMTARLAKSVQPGFDPFFDQALVW